MLSDISILHVEDDTLLTQSLGAVLGVYNVYDAAASIKDGECFLRERKYNVVLLDRQLPDGTADFLIRLAKQVQPSSAIIVITGETEFLPIAEYLRLGAHDYLFKSAHLLQDLLLRIPVVLAHFQLQQKQAGESLPCSVEELTSEHYQRYKMRCEKEYLIRALQLIEGDVELLAKKLELGRSTVFKRLADLGISRNRIVVSSKLEGTA